MRNLSNIALENNRSLIQESTEEVYWPLFGDPPLGCGEYGCVYETNSDDILCKITTDQQEAKFVFVAMNLGEWPEGMIQYYQFLRLPIASKWGQFALWRENANMVGELSETEVHPMLLDALERCWQLAKKVARETPTWKMYGQENEINHWTDLYSKIALSYIGDVDEFGSILYAMSWYARKGILLGDVHLGNFGLVNRLEHKEPIWVITDPGEAVFVDDRYNNLLEEAGFRI